MATKKAKLFDDSSDDEEGKKPTLAINANYAERYTNWRQKEELQKCQF